MYRYKVREQVVCKIVVNSLQQYLNQPLRLRIRGTRHHFAFQTLDMQNHTYVPVERIAYYTDQPPKTKTKKQMLSMCGDGSLILPHASTLS